MMSTPYATLQYGHSEEMGLLRETVHQFATEEIAPRAADIDRDNDFPRDLWQKMGSLGLLGITIPDTYGGSGMATSPTRLPWKKYRAPVRRWGSLMALTPTSA